MMKNILEKYGRLTGIKIMLLCLCAHFTCLTVIADDLDPLSILDDDSSQNDGVLIAPVSTGAFDIQNLTNARISDYNGLSTFIPVSNFIAEVKSEKSPDNLPVILKNDPNKKSSVISYQPSQDDDIHKIIEKLRLITADQEKQVKTEPEQKINKEPDVNEIVTSARKPNVPQVSPLDSQEIPQEKTELPLLNPEILKQVDVLIKDPNLISNPLELAEILYKSGRTSQAAVCYKKALAATPADDPNFAHERAWILFQIGNCLQFEDPNTARESFTQLLSTQPDSPWAPVAKTARDLTDWLQQEQPQQLIRELKK